MSWEVLVEKRRGRAPKSWAGIRIYHVRGTEIEGWFQISFSVGVMSKFGLESGDYCRLLIDNDKKLICIQKCGPMEGYKAYAAKGGESQRSCSVKWTCEIEKTNECRGVLIGETDHDKRYVPMNDLDFTDDGIVLKFA